MQLGSARVCRQSRSRGCLKNRGRLSWRPRSFAKQLQNFLIPGQHVLEFSRSSSVNIGANLQSVTPQQNVDLRAAIRCIRQRNLSRSKLDIRPRTCTCLLLTTPRPDLGVRPREPFSGPTRKGASMKRPRRRDKRWKLIPPSASGQPLAIRHTD